MFSLENFYHILYSNLLENKNIRAHYFYPFGSTSPDNLIILGATRDTMFSMPALSNMSILFHDQEPLPEDTVWAEKYKNYPALVFNSSNIIKVLVNSEHSEFKNQLCQQNKLTDWYYFYHGFAALDWYRDYAYIRDTGFTKKFLCLNRITTGDRSYRLTLVAHLMQRKLLDDGLVSLNIDDIGNGAWKDEVGNECSLLTRESKELINDHIANLSQSLVLDKYQPDSACSAHVGSAEMALSKSSLWHVVTETVFYYNKQHLTEKIFRPIVSKRPFILVGAPHNLAYLKSYGFKTFDKWIDESYDRELDNSKRLQMIVDQIEKICCLSMSELTQMHLEMQEIIEHNHTHFYNTFKKIIVSELVDNFQSIVTNWNKQCNPARTINVDNVDFVQVARLLSS